MPDLPPESFQVRLPLWCLVHRGSAQINEPADPVTMGLSIGHVVIKLDWGNGNALALFSDEARAIQFANAHAMAGLLSTRVVNAPQLKELMLRLPPETTHLAFNPPHPSGGPGSAPVVPVAEMLATLRAVVEGAE
jgi:hypothetical protein